MVGMNIVRISVVAPSVTRIWRGLLITNSAMRAITFSPRSSLVAGEEVVLWYPPTGAASGTLPAGEYQVPWVSARYQVVGDNEDDFLEYVLDQVDTLYGLDYTATLGTVAGTTFYGPADTWPSNPLNEPWITFWRDLDSAIGDSLATEKLADEFWRSLGEVALPGHIDMDMYEFVSDPVGSVEMDQLGNVRQVGMRGDVGAVELP